MSQCCQKFILIHKILYSLLYFVTELTAATNFLTLGMSESLKKQLWFLGRVVVWQSWGELHVKIPALRPNSSYLGNFLNFYIVRIKKDNVIWKCVAHCGWSAGDDIKCCFFSFFLVFRFFLNVSLSIWLHQVSVTAHGILGLCCCMQDL